MRVAVIHTIAGQPARLQSLMERLRTLNVGALFVVGNVAGTPMQTQASSTEPAIYTHAIDLLGSLGVPVYLVPGEQDVSLAALTHAVETYRGAAHMHLVHRHAALLGDGDVVAGFGGALTATPQRDPALLQFPEWEARVAFEHLAAYSPLFATARRRILLFATPPHGTQIDRAGGTHVGAHVLNRIIHTYQPDLVCCGGPASGRGVDVIAGARVVNPGPLTEGAYALVDLDTLEVHLERLPERIPDVPQVFRSIVVALDGSAEAWHALELAAGLARAFESRLTLVHAFEPVHQTLESPYLEETIGQRVAEAERLLNEASRYVDDLQPQCEVVEGPAADAIIRVAEAQHADVIVMGARGIGAVHTLLGSVSHRVLRHAPCPVLLTRQTPLSPALAERSISHHV